MTTILKHTSRRLLQTMASIPKTQYGFVFDKASRSLKLMENLPVKTPTSSQVLIKIKAAGLCHSDLHVLDGLDVGDNFVMGHEIFGEVVQIGEAVSSVKVGDRVAAFGPNGCGECSFCRQGLDNDCQESKWFGLGGDGGYQQYLLVEKARNLVKVPDEVADAGTAAVVTDAMLTPYHAIKKAKMTPTTKALFIGAGGLGSTAVQIAKIFGSHITIVDKKQEALDLAKLLGANEAYTELPAHILPASFDVCLDFVAVQSTFDMCQKYVKAHGIIVPVGLGAERLSFDLADLSLREVRLLGTFWGTSNDLAECYDIVKDGQIHPKTATFPLKELPQCIQKLRNGEVTGRMVLVPE